MTLPCFIDFPLESGEKCLLQLNREGCAMWLNLRRVLWMKQHPVVFQVTVPWTSLRWLGGTVCRPSPSPQWTRPSSLCWRWPPSWAPKSSITEVKAAAAAAQKRSKCFIKQREFNGISFALNGIPDNGLATDRCDRTYTCTSAQNDTEFFFYHSSLHFLSALTSISSWRGDFFPLFSIHF